MQQIEYGLDYERGYTLGPAHGLDDVHKISTIGNPYKNQHVPTPPPSSVLEQALFKLTDSIDDFMGEQ